MGMASVHDCYSLLALAISIGGERSNVSTYKLSSSAASGYHHL